MTIALFGMVCLWSIFPGPATLMILNDAWVHGKWAGLITALGGCAGVFVYTGLAVLQGALFTDMSMLGSQDIWVTLLKIAGAAAMAILGLISLNEGVSNFIESPTGRLSPIGQTMKPYGFINGFYLSFLSPQVALFYLVVLPQIEITLFSSLWSIVIIGLFHMIFRTGWYVLLIQATASIHPYATALFMKGALKMLSGLLFLLLSVGVIA